MHIILDRGHGSDTRGKRSPKWPNGKRMFEWEFNQAIVDRVHNWLEDNSSRFRSIMVYPETKKDVPVYERRLHYEEYAKRKKDVLMISVHGDAFSKETAKGGTCFTSPGFTESDVYAGIFKKAYEYYELPVRTSKEAKYTVLMGLGYSAVLLEMGFYTNFQECMYMMSEEGRDMYANMVIKGITDILEYKKTNKSKPKKL